MQAVRRGDADHVHVRVGQQVPVLHVGLGAGRLGGFVQPVAVGIVHRHDLRVLARLDQPLHRADMAGAAPADADEANADSVVGAEHAAARHKRRGAQQAHGRGGPGSGLEEVPAVDAHGWIGLGLHSSRQRAPAFMPAPAQNSASLLLPAFSISNSRPPAYPFRMTLLQRVIEDSIAHPRAERPGETAEPGREPGGAAASPPATNCWSAAMAAAPPTPPTWPPSSSAATATTAGPTPPSRSPPTANS